MLAAERFSTTSSRTVGQYTAEPALGTAYVAIRTDTPDEAKSAESSVEQQPPCSSSC